MKHLNTNIKFLIVLISIYFSTLLFTEVFGQRCGFDALRAKADPAQVAQRESNLRMIREQIRKAGKTQQDLTFELPVVVHVIHDGGPENISDEQVNSQITELNRSFENLSLPNGNKLTLHFFLAKCGPDGDSTTQGIVRVRSPYTVHGPGPEGSSEIQLKGLSYWNSRRYLNIWTVRSLGGSILGYTQYIQSLSNDTLDGVVVASKYLGTTGNLTAPYNEGKTTVHEVGHYLGLYHPFDNSCSGALAETCELEGDMVCDTPPSSGPIYGCPANKNTCIEFPEDKPDLVNNYMQYTDDRCMNAFTAGQSERMLSFLYGYRSELISANNIARTNCLPVSRDKQVYAAASNTLQVYPSPFQDNIQLINHLQVEGGTFELIDSWGRVVFAQVLSPTTQALFSVANIPAGVYYARLTNHKGIFSTKVMKL